MDYPGGKTKTKIKDSIKKNFEDQPLKGHEFRFNNRCPVCNQWIDAVWGEQEARCKCGLVFRLIKINGQKV